MLFVFVFIFPFFYFWNSKISALKEKISTRDLPQSSLIIDSDTSLCMDRFVDPPRTLYDEIGEQEQDVFITVKSAEEHIEKDWNIIVMQLQQQNESLMQTLQETTNDLEKSRHEKKELEYFIEQQMNMHEQTVEELNDKINQLEVYKSFILHDCFIYLWCRKNSS